MSATIRLAIAGIHIESSTFSPLRTSKEDFQATRGAEMLGLDPLLHTITVVKIGYLEPELKAMDRHHFLVLSPGAVPPKIDAIPYEKVIRPLYPLDDRFDWQPSPRLFHSTFSTP